jgi:hypothetical protein
MAHCEDLKAGVMREVLLMPKQAPRGGVDHNFYLKIDG